MIWTVYLKRTGNDIFKKKSRAIINRNFKDLDENLASIKVYIHVSFYLPIFSDIQPLVLH